MRLVVQFELLADRVDQGKDELLAEVALTIVPRSSRLAANLGDERENESKTSDPPVRRQLGLKRDRRPARRPHEFEPISRQRTRTYGAHETALHAGEDLPGDEIVRSVGLDGAVRIARNRATAVASRGVGAYHGAKVDGAALGAGLVGTGGLGEAGEQEQQQ